MVYILHLDTPLAHARHYVGFSTNKRTLRERLIHHAKGTANCRFTQVLHDLGITFTLARVFRGKKYDRNFERKLKNTHDTARYCPICSGQELPYTPRRKEKNATDKT